MDALKQLLVDSSDLLYQDKKHYVDWLNGIKKKHLGLCDRCIFVFCRLSVPLCPSAALNYLQVCVSVCFRGAGLTEHCAVNAFIRLRRINYNVFIQFHEDKVE